MPRRPTIVMLPTDIRHELDKRLVECSFGDYHAHAAWLGEKGYPISKSAVHRYASEKKVDIHAAANGVDVDSVTALRMRCLEVAARFSEKTTLIDDAERLLQWVLKP